jgi:hypothetical protein
MMNANESTQAEVLNVIRKLLETYQKRDIDGLMSLMAADDDLFMFGTNIDEKRQGRNEFKAQAERDGAQTEALAFKSLALKSDGMVVGWGDSFGTGAETPPTGLSDVIAIAAGRCIIAELISRSKAKGIPLKLQVLKVNSGAKRLYERLGLKVIGESSTHLQMEMSI